MAHASGNPTWQAYPDTSTLVTALALENIENAVDTVLARLMGSSATVSARNTGSALATTSTSYAVIPSTGVAFVAPPSGIVLLHHSAGMNNTTANGGCLVAPVVLTGSSIGSGPSVLAASDDNAVTNYTVSTQDIGKTTRLAGLTAGSSYNVQLHVRAGSTGTANHVRQCVIVQPLIA